MPISSFHGLRKNSIPTKPWNSTRSSPQRSSPTETRKRSIFGVPQLWTSNEFQDAFEDDQDIERYYNKCSGSPPVVNHTPKSRGKTLRKPSLNSQPNSTRIKRVGLKRRETFPKFSGECSRRSEAAKVLRRSQTDPTIFPADKKPRKDSYKPLKRPSLLWTVSKKEENSSAKFRRRKINKSHSPPSSSSPDGSVDSSFSRKRPRQGDKVVCILNKTPQLGILKYIGTTHFADGEWCGILLDEPCGKNDGSVRGVRYFRCRNKYGIFVHSYKVKRADETTLSRLNLLDGFSSPASTEKPDEKGLDTTISRMSSSNVDKISGGNNIYNHPDVKSLRLTKKNRSVSLDRILFQKTKQLAKSLNIFIQNATDKGDKNSWDPNRINRSVSLPKITKNGHYSSTDDCLAGEMAPLAKGENIVKEERSTANGEQKGFNRTTNSTCDSGCEKEDLNGSRKPSECQDGSKHCNSSRSQNVPRSVTAVPKVGHAVSLDTHLLMENGQFTYTATDANDELSCQSHFGNKEDPFLQGRHCSCPSLHSDDHFSEAIKTCLSLGRAERPVIHETNGETEATLETAQVSGFSFNHGVQPHSQSEALEKLFQKTEIGRSKSSSSRDADLRRKGSWPWLTSTPKSSLRSYGSSDDINGGDMTGNDNVLDEGYRPILAHAKLISSHLADKSFRLEKSGTFSGTGDIVVESKEAGPVSSGKDSVDSSYANSPSGSQGSLSSTGTSDSKGKKIPAKNRIPINSAKIPGSKPSGIHAPKSIPKQSKLEQIRQQQHNRKSALPSAVKKTQLADQTTANPGKKTDSKMTKRHTLATVQDVKTSVPRPSVCKRPVSDGVASLVGNSDKELDTTSKLPVKKMSMPQFSKPSTALHDEKNSKATTLIHKRHSVATSRPPTAPLAKGNSSVARSNSKTRKPSDVNVVQKSESNDQGSGVVRQKVTGAQQTPSASAGLKGVVASGPKSQTSRAIQSSNLPKAKGPLAKEGKSRPAPSNKKPAAQTWKQITKQPPSNQRPGSSKLPRKLSAAPSNASDSASVTSSLKDQDNLDDLHDADIDTVSVSTDTSDRDARLPSYGHFQQDEADGKVESPIEVPSCRIMPPDILSETPYLSKHSIGIQVEDDSDSKTIQALKEKGRHLHELVKQRTELCWQLQDQIDEDSLDFVSASVMILSVVHKLQWSQRCSDQLQRKIQSTMEELSVIQEKLAEEEANSVKLQEEMMYQSSEHAVAIETLKADYENVLERTSNELKMKHEGEIALAIETHKAQVHEMRQHHEKEVSELKKSHEEVIASVKEAHRDEIVELESKHSSATDELVEEHQVEIETIKADYDEQQLEFKEKYDKVVSDCSMLNKKLQQAQDQNQKDIETRIQEEIKKYESLPAELDSLKAVLEMKNEEIKRLRTEKMEKHLELEKLEDIKTQTQKLQHENESLSFVVETKSRFERQLSVERDSLRNSLERESAKSKRLSLENEELQWRLINSTSPPGTPSDDGRPLSASSRNSFRLSASFPDVEAIDE